MNTHKTAVQRVFLVMFTFIPKCSQISSIYKTISYRQTKPPPFQGVFPVHECLDYKLANTMHNYCTLGFMMNGQNLPSFYYCATVCIAIGLGRPAISSVTGQDGHVPFCKRNEKP